MTDTRSPKPSHLAPKYGAQFGDEAVAAAYRHRPPYPQDTFAIVEPLLGERPRRVLELGAGTGDFTVGLAPLVEALVAVEPSEPMLECARRRDGASASHVQWIATTAEAHGYDGRYSGAVAAESFHWLDWHAVIPRLASCLAPGGHLILVDRRLAAALPWESELRAVIAEYSTNRDYSRTDTVGELAARGLFAVEGSTCTRPAFHRQSVEEYVESFHSRNGFSRSRLDVERSREFDARVSTLVRRHVADDLVRLPIQAHVTWGRPLAG